MTTTAEPNVQVPIAGAGNNDADTLRKRLGELRDEFAALDPGKREGWTEQDGSALDALIREARSLDAQLTTVLAMERLEQVRSGASGGHSLAATGVQGTREQWKSGAQRMVESDQFREWADGGHSGDFRWQGKGLTVDDFQQTRAVFEWAAGGPPTYDGTGSGNLLPVGQPIPPIPRQAKLYLRDLIPVMRTSLAAVPYVQELNPTSNEAASAVAEGGLKPSATIAFQGAKADPTVIAATLTLSKQLFEDAPLVVQYVNNRLPYIVKFKEDWEFLNGNGTWPDIQGILGASGVLTQAATAGDPAVSIGNGFADVEMHDGAVTAVVMNPVDAWAMFIKRAAGGSGTFDAGTPFSALPLTVWGVPTYRTRAKAAGTALTADFQRGATIVDRETVNVQTYRERYAELNEILLVCEERVGLMIQRPDLFCIVTL